MQKNAKEFNPLIDPPPKLPDFRNLGVMARTIVAVNLAMLLHLLFACESWQSLQSRILDGAMWVEPIMLVALSLLALLQRVLSRLSYWQGVALSVMTCVASTRLILMIFDDLVPDSARYFPLRFELGTACVTFAMLMYYRLWMKALSPRVAEARLAALQARIRPHFFFNSLNAVLSLIRNEPRRAERMLEDLSDLFRVAMGKQDGLSTMKREVDLARGYLEIEKLRLGERMQVEWFIDKMPGEATIPPLILQPLVENAVYHGIEPSMETGVIQINIFRVRQEVHIDIRNPIVAKGERRRTGNGIALANVRERLLLHFDAAASLTTQVGNDYYQIHIVLPYTELLDEQSITPLSGR